MKFLENIVEGLRPNFEKGGKFERYYKAFEAFETFAFTPGHVTHGGAHVRDAIDLKRTMFTVVIAMLPVLLFGIYNTGYQYYTSLGQEASMLEMIIFGAMKVLPLIVVSYGVGLGIEFAIAVYKNHSVNEGYLVSGLLIPLCLPVDVPLWMVAVATAFAVIIGKEVFGGTGMNILNVALTARAFLFFAYPTKMSGNEVWIANSNEIKAAGVDAFTGATALGDAANKIPVDQIMAKYSLMDSFLGFIPGSVGETSTLACLIGAAILIFSGIGSWKIILSTFVGGFVMGAIFNAFHLNPLMEIPAIHHLCLGGFAFGAVYMATDPVTASQTEFGKYIYGFFIGVFAILIRVFNPAYPEGVMLAILFMNVMAPLIDHYVVESNIKRRLNRVKIA
jgi:Na+-transporting NADH:ubiquinone oxidoreductase subunit B